MSLELDPNDPVVRAIIASVGQNETVLSRLNAHLQGLIPTFIEEYGTSNDPGANAIETFTMSADRDTFFKVVGIYVQVPLNTVSATLQLGSQFIIPIQNTTTLITPVQRILRSTDVRQLIYKTGANGGTAFVWLWGDAHPSYGNL